MNVDRTLLWPMLAMVALTFVVAVLFYVACLTLALVGTGGLLLPSLAWGYVALRVLHSAIHLGGHRVRWRFDAFAASAAMLLAIWLPTAVELAGLGAR